MAAGARPQIAGRFLLVDPLDGTREFLAGNGEFTINVALIEAAAPIAGAVYAPAIGRLWVGGDAAFACEVRLGAELPEEGSRRRIRTRRAPSSLDALVSRSHLDPQSDSFLKGLPIAKRGLRVRRSSFALSPRASATSIRGSRQRWNGIRRRATRCCAPPAASFAILQDGRFVTAKSIADCATAPSSLGATQRPQGNLDINVK